MFIEVIPQSHSISTRPLTYSVGDVLCWNIFIGSLIRIPLGKQEILGIVAHIDTSHPGVSEVREVIDCVSIRPILAPYQIKLIEKIAQKYMLPIHRVLQWFFPRPIELRLEKRGFDLLPCPDEYPDKIEWDIGKLLLLRDRIIDHIVIGKYLQNMQVIIAPDDFLLYSLEPYFSDDQTLFLTSDFSDTKRAKAWIDIANGKFVRIFWTRKILYYNLQAYSQILYLEDAFSREYFHFPTRIQYLDILSFLDQAHQFHIHILSSSPFLKTLSMFRHYSIEYPVFVE
jgi:primosomal protein N'